MTYSVESHGSVYMRVAQEQAFLSGFAPIFKERINRKRVFSDNQSSKLNMEVKNDCF